jgi:hypothetical protein
MIASKVVLSQGRLKSKEKMVLRSRPERWGSGANGHLPRSAHCPAVQNSATMSRLQAARRYSACTVCMCAGWGQPHSTPPGRDPADPHYYASLRSAPDWDQSPHLPQSP